MPQRVIQRFLCNIEKFIFDVLRQCFEVPPDDHLGINIRAPLNSIQPLLNGFDKPFLVYD